jgi:hypothetical protein
VSGVKSFNLHEANMAVTENITTVFSSPEIGWIHFRFANRLIAPASYRSMLELLKSGRLNGGVNRDLGDRTEYNPSKDTIFAGNEGFGANLFVEKSVLVHEGVHAILDNMAGKDADGKAAPMKVLADETMGYLAGAMYLIVMHDAIVRDTPENKPSLEAVKAVRAKIEALNAAAEKAKTPPFNFDGVPGSNAPLEFTPTDVRALQAAIKQHPWYIKEWDDAAQHDGIK